MALNSHIFNNSLIITGSVTSSVGYKGDGSGLTNITSSAEWDGSRNGNASITGSLVVSGSGVNVDFNNTTGVSGSFSGSFSGNGSGLTNLNITGLTGNNVILTGSYSGSFTGDGSGLTGLNIFPFDGDAVITGSLTVSSSVVDFTNSTAISGSIFSGSFVGDASGLTNLPATEWDGSRNGNASITGSFVVSGSNPTIDLKGLTTIDHNIEISNRASTSSTINSFAIGSGSLPTSTLNRNALVIGHNAAPVLTSGSNNIAIGNSSFQSAIKTENNIALGICSLRDYVGANLGTSTNPGGNIAIGFKTQLCNTTGKFNTVVGDQANSIGKDGCQQTFIGAFAGKNSDADNNVAVGYEAACRNEAGTDNTAVGTFAGMCMQGSCNTVLGSNALIARHSGCGNLVLGYSAAKSVSNTSNLNVYIGFNAGPSTSTVQCNQLYIGNSSGETPLLRGDFDKQQLTINNQVSASLFSGSFVGDGSGLTNISGSGFPFTGEAQITGSLIISRSLGHNSNALHIKNGHVVLTMVSESLNFTKDSAAAAAGVPLGGLYRSGNFIAIRLK